MKNISSARVFDFLSKVIRMLMSKTALFAVVFAVLMTIGYAAPCTTLRAMSLERLVVASDAVVLGRVVGAQTLREFNGRIVTIVTYDVEQYVVGNGSEQLSIRLLGGTMDGVTQYVHGETHLPDSETTLLFLEQYPTRSNKTFVVSGLSQGVFRIVEGNGTTTRFAVRDQANLNLIDPPTIDKFNLAQPRTSTFLPLDKLLTAIRELAEKKQ